ncbi:hypothetical protein FRB97_004976 [Tulasnella sp. 331]|nr:hypothetical protein FRB97_004976 [Tulasnella sp. 331]
MPRRSAPSALRLHKGPIPEFKLRMPQPPVPVLTMSRPPLPKVSIAVNYSRPSASSRPSTLIASVASQSEIVRPPWNRSRGFSVAAQDSTIWSPITPPRPVASLTSSPTY